MIKEAFLESLQNYSSDKELSFSMWREVEKNYSQSGRHYHTLTHLASLVRELNPYQEKFASWDAVVFAITYHDIIYKPMRSNNEEKSAELATQRLTDISFPDNLKFICREFILATKKHAPGDFETNLFTDADLSVLGGDLTEYKKYAAQIRREYSIYPDVLYYPGRKKVLLHFLSMERIFKTDEFSTRYEKKARANLQTELATIVGGTF